MGVHLTMFEGQKYKTIKNYMIASQSKP